MSDVDDDKDYFGDSPKYAKPEVVKDSAPWSAVIAMAALFFMLGTIMSASWSTQTRTMSIYWKLSSVQSDVSQMKSDVEDIKRSIERMKR